MTHSAAALPPLHTCLKPGQSLRLYLDRHATLFVARGAVTVIAPPLWLGEQLLVERTGVPEGQAFVPTRDGWTEIVAAGDGPVELLQMTDCRASTVARPAGWGSLLASLATALVQRMRALRGVS